MMGQCMNDLPGLRLAALEIARDNGIINRDHTEQDFLKDCDEVIGADGVYMEDLVKMDTFLQTLTKGQMSHLCCGEYEGPEREVVLDLYAGDRDMLDGLLDDLFSGPKMSPAETLEMMKKISQGDEYKPE